MALAVLFRAGVIVVLLQISKTTFASSDPSRLSPGTFHSLPDIGLVTKEAYIETSSSQPIFYEKVIPLILQYKIWAWSDFVLENYTSQCSTESGNSVASGHSVNHGCSIINPLGNIFEKLSAFQNEIMDKPSTSNLSATEISKIKSQFQKMLWKPQFCQTVQRHFFTTKVSNQELQLYLETIVRGCARASGEIAQISESLNWYNLTIKTLIQRVDYNTVKQLYAYVGGYPGSGFLHAMKVALQSMLLANFYEQKNRWIAAANECAQGRIPITLVSHAELTQSLNRVQAGSSLSISPSPQEFLTYYDLPLADCVRTEDTLLVRVLVPALSTKSKYNLQLVQLTPIHYLYNGQVCRINLKRDASAIAQGSTSEKSKLYIHDKDTGRAYLTTCKPSELCKISSETFSNNPESSYDACATFIISGKVEDGNETDIGAHCDIFCDSKDDFRLPTVVKVSSSKFVVTGDINPLQILCKDSRGESKRAVYAMPSKFGTKLVTVPCYCQINLPNSTEEFYGDPLCEFAGPSVHNQEFTVHPVLPMMLIKSSSGNLLGKHSGGTFGGVESFTDTLSFFNLTEIADTEKLDGFINKTRKMRLEPQQALEEMYAKDQAKLLQEQQQQQEKQRSDQENFLKQQEQRLEQQGKDHENFLQQQQQRLEQQRNDQENFLQQQQQRLEQYRKDQESYFSEEYVNHSYFSTAVLIMGSLLVINTLIVIFIALKGFTGTCTCASSAQPSSQPLSHSRNRENKNYYEDEAVRYRVSENSVYATVDGAFN